MDRKIIALASSDWHIHKFRAFDKEGSRLKYSLNAAKILLRYAETLGVPLLFSGDLLHTPKDVENETMSKLQRVFAKNKATFVGISGNHDMSEKNSFEHQSPSHLDSFTHFKHFYKIDRDVYLNGDLWVYGIPYMNNDHDIVRVLSNVKLPPPQMTKVKILLLHSDAPGAMTPEGFRVDDCEHINYDMFKGWDLVLFGHIHKAQKLADNAYMLGCPIHQNAGDAGNACGYWEVYSDGSITFRRLDNFPQFVKLKPGEKPYDSVNYFIMPEEVVAEEEIQQGEFNLSKSKKKLAKQYVTAKNIKSKTKLRALTEILNTATNE